MLERVDVWEGAVGVLCEITWMLEWYTGIGIELGAKVSKAVDKIFRSGFVMVVFGWLSFWYRIATILGDSV